MRINSNATLFADGEDLQRTSRATEESLRTKYEKKKCKEDLRNRGNDNIREIIQTFTRLTEKQSKWD